MLKFILIVLCVFFIFRILARMFVAKTFNNLNKRFEEEQQRRQQQSAPPKPEGRITIDPNASGNTSSSSDGEYVDYEEVK